jgi:two-component system, chemotaxis family, chemotaxis protein CheY
MENKEEVYKNINILVLDDVSFYYSLIKDHLKIIGFEGNLFKASNVLEGIDVLKEQRNVQKAVDLIICDLNMPKFTGLDFIKTIRGSKNFTKVPIMLFTSFTENERIIEAIQAGANTYLTKPWEAIQLKEKLIESLTNYKKD